MRRKGVLTQTRRHSRLVSLVGIKQGGAGGEQDRPGRTTTHAVFDRIVADYSRLRRRAWGSRRSSPIPVSGLKGDNVIACSPITPPGTSARPCWNTWRRWRRTHAVRQDRSIPLCRCSGSIVRPLDFRGFSGLVTSRTRSTVGEARARAAGRASEAVDRAHCHRRRRSWPEARSGSRRSPWCWIREIDVSRGDLIVGGRASRAEVSDRFEPPTWPGWSEAALDPEQDLSGMKIGVQHRARPVSPAPSNVVDVETGADRERRLPPSRLNGIGAAEITLDPPHRLRSVCGGAAIPAASS